MVKQRQITHTDIASNVTWTNASSCTKSLPPTATPCSTATDCTDCHPLQHSHNTTVAPTTSLIANEWSSQGKRREWLGQQEGVVSAAEAYGNHFMQGGASSEPCIVQDSLAAHSGIQRCPTCSKTDADFSTKWTFSRHAPGWFCLLCLL